MTAITLNTDNSNSFTMSKLLNNIINTLSGFKWQKHIKYQRTTDTKVLVLHTQYR